MKKLILTAAGAAIAVLLGIFAYLALWPVAIDPVAWDPPPAPDPTGVWAPNDALAQVNRLTLPDGDYGPEDLHRIGEVLYGGTRHGAILAWTDLNDPPTEVANTGGRPLGLHADASGRLIIADAFKGLLRLEPNNTLTTLCDKASDGSPLVFTDDVDIASDGAIWFSDASTRHDQTVWKRDILENRPNGRLLVWRPEAPQCEVVQDGLYFANGIALAADDAFVLINETSRYRVQRRWLTGPRAGQTEVFVDRLPGFPDGISRGTDGQFWIAIASPRNALVDALAGYPGLRKVIERLPEALKPAPIRHPYAIEVDADGTVLRTLQDPTGARFGVVTSVQQHDDRLYLGSLSEPAGAWLPNP